MNIYIAGNPRSHAGQMHQLLSRAKAAGHAITHDWMTAYEAKNETRQQAAIEDLRGAMEADLIVVVDAERLAGAWTELGATLADGGSAMIVGPIYYDQVFYSHPRVFKVDSIEQALNVIGCENPLRVLRCMPSTAA